MSYTVIAITGDVGAGKSTVAKIFESLGGFLIDADCVVAELWKTPDMIRAAVGRWGAAVLGEEGHILHKPVADRIFSDKAEYDWLTGLLYPQVMNTMKNAIENAIEDRAETRKWGIAEIPLFFEAGGASWVTATVFVTPSRDVRVARCRRRGWSEAEMERRESFFLPRQERMRRSDHVIENNGNLEMLKKNVQALLEGYRCT